jgi:hypothetical protein
MSQHEEQRQPTLPLTPAGKVNVRAVAQAINLKPTQEKCLFESDQTDETDQLYRRRPGRTHHLRSR